MKPTIKSIPLRTIGLLLLVVIFFGCKKNQELPTRTDVVKNIKTTSFSVSFDSLSFSIPISMISGANEIRAKGTLITSLTPEFSSYVILRVNGTAVWHSSLMDSSVELCTDDLRSLITGPSIDCTLEFYNVSNVHGPFKCSGSFLFTMPD